MKLFIVEEEMKKANILLKIRVLKQFLRNVITVRQFVCFNLGFASLQTDSSAPALPPEGGFGTPQ